MNCYYIILLILPSLLFFNSPISSWTFKEINQAFDSLPEQIKELSENEKYYTDKGNLFIDGSQKGFTNIINLSIKKSALERIPHFMILFCLEPNTTCTSGITICYNSQLNSEYIEPIYKIDARNRNDFNCQNKKHSAFCVYTDPNRENFFVKASIDKHIYKFPIPRQSLKVHNTSCFILNVGNKNSFETTITDVDGKKLIFTGNQPKDFVMKEPLVYSLESKNLMNLWMLLLDVVPITPVMDYNVLPLQFTYGDKSCGLTAEFSSANDETINRCFKNLDEIGSCISRKLEGASTHCEVELRISQGFEVESEIRKALKEGKQKDVTNSDEVGGGLEVNGEVGLPLVGKVGIKVIGSYKHTWSNTHSDSKEIEMAESATNREMTEAQQAVKMLVHRTDGRSVHFYQLNLNCGGLTYRTKTIIAIGDHEGIDDKYKDTEVIEAKEGSEIILPAPDKKETKKIEEVRVNKANGKIHDKNQPK